MGLNAPRPLPAGRKLFPLTANGAKPNMESFLRCGTSFFGAGLEAASAAPQPHTMSIDQTAAPTTPPGFAIGLFGANCSGGLAVTTVADRWNGSWSGNLALARMAEAADYHHHYAIECADEEAVARQIVTLACAGLDGIALSFVDYLAELPLFVEEVLPRLTEAGIRPGAR